MRADLQHAIDHHAVRDVDALSRLVGSDRLRSMGTAGERLVGAMEAVGRAGGFPIVVPEDVADDHLTIEAIARASHLRWQRVHLPDAWWRSDHGPLIVRRDGTDDVVALIPRLFGGYEMVDPGNGRPQAVDAAISAGLDRHAWCFHPVFPDRVLTLRDALSFGLPRAWRDVVTLLLAGTASATFAMAIPWSIGMLFSEIVPAADRGHLVQIGLAMLVVVAAVFALDCAAGLAQARVLGRCSMQLQVALWDRLLRLPATFAGRSGAGDLASRLATGAQLQESMLRIVQGLASRGQHVVVSLVTMFFVSAAAGLAALGMAVLLVLVAVAFTFAQRRVVAGGQAMQGNLYNQPVEYLGAIGKLRSAGAEERAFSRWSGNFILARDRSLRAARLNNGFLAFCAAFETVALLAVFAVMMHATGPGSTLGLGAALMLISAFGTFVSSLLALNQTGLATAIILARGVRLNPLLQSVPPAVSRGADPGALDGHVELRGVSMRYDPHGPLVLDQVSIEARPGELVAIVGPTGCGKSSVVRALLGLAPLAHGTVRFDGRELATLDADAVRRQVGTVLQSGSLQPGSILDNIRGPHEATVDAAWEAARLAAVDDDIRAMPMQMMTQVLDGASTFSGGQVQRILVARALVGRPPVVIFDEATSALDGRTQALVVERVGALACTRIVIAHRFSTIRHADRVYVMDGGRVVEQGSVDQLLASGGYLAQMAAREGVRVLPPAASVAPDTGVDDILAELGAARRAAIAVPAVPRAGQEVRG